MSDDPGCLSLRLCAVLERIGVSESMRKMYRDTGISNEIMETITQTMINTNTSYYKFGSACEGTTTPDMGSDLDVVACQEHLPVIEHIQEAPPGEALLMVTSRHTQPGYVKLQRVLDGIPLTIYNSKVNVNQSHYDCEGRLCTPHFSTVDHDAGYNERNGPADTVSDHPVIVSMDFVTALRCRTFPHVATESLYNCNTCGWMSGEDVERMKRYGIFLVAVGCQMSKEFALEWRISFSHQERDLMFALNPTQHKCYVLLKIVKNLITAHPDVGKSLTSYHCKTCLFTIITNTSPELWTEKNLIKCTCICLSALKSWIYRGYCPNFFIKESNMFERRGFKEAQERLLYYMRDILHEGPMLFYHIQSDDIGEALRGLPDGQFDLKRFLKFNNVCSRTCAKHTMHMYGVLIRACEHILFWQNHVLIYCKNLPSNQHIARYLIQNLHYMTTIDKVTEHTRDQVQMAVRRLEPVMHKLLAQHLASVAFSTDDPASRHRLLADSDRHLNQAKNCDRMSSSLLEATILYRKKNLKYCCNLLEHIERQLMHKSVISLCRCYIQGFDRNFYLEEMMSSGSINQQNIMESAVAPCMIFLPSQSEIIPEALQYEIYRSDGSFVSTHSNKCKWYGFAVVDSKLYLHFLQYLVYSDLNNPLAKIIAIDNILKVLKKDPNIGHGETGYNLLGWIYIQEGWIQAAIECFMLSWRIRPDNNAAKWHLLGLLMRLREQR